MRKFNKIIGFNLLLSMITLGTSIVYHIKIEKLSQFWALPYVLQDYLALFPLIAALSLLWPMVFRSKNEMQNPESPVSVNFFVVIYFFLSLGVSFAIQELAIPKLYEYAGYQDVLKTAGVKKAPRIKDETGAKFTMAEFSKVRLMPRKENLAFGMGRSCVYFQKMYNGNGAYYVENFRFIAYTQKNQIEYILTADWAKIVSTELMVVNPRYFEYSGGRLVKSRKIDGIKRIALSYEPEAIYALSSESTAKVASLIDLFLYTDYVYSSKINFYHLGNLVFNKIAYYISLTLILIIIASIATVFKNQRPIVLQEYPHAAAFILLSIAGTALIYDTLAAAATMIYGLVI